MGLADSEALWRATYAELLRLAARHLAREGPGHALGVTGLAHEAWLRLARDRSTSFLDGSAYCRAAATAMQRILVDHARRRSRKKRTAAIRQLVDPDCEQIRDERDAAGLLDLEDSLQKLQHLSPRRAAVLRLRYFGGLNEVETAATIGVCRRTVQMDCRTARAWLASRMGASEA